jgi:hypothetical protein
VVVVFVVIDLWFGWAENGTLRLRVGKEVLICMVMGLPPRTLEERPEKTSSSGDAVMVSFTSVIDGFHAPLPEVFSSTCLTIKASFSD